MTNQPNQRIFQKKYLFLIIILLIYSKLFSQPQIINTIAGNGNPGFYGDLGLAINSEIDTPTDIEIDKIGNIYFTDRNNSRIRRIDTSGIITTIAGNGLWGFSGDNGPAISATLNRPTGITLDSIGNIYFFDEYRIRKIDTLGIITTIGGNGNHGYTGDGGIATSASLGAGFGIASDKFGNIFIADFDNQVIRKIDTSGIINTIAGDGTPGNSGDGGLAINAKLNYPNWVKVDHLGNIFISEMSNNKIRKVNTFGIITTIAGSNTGSPGFGGDGGPATAALLNSPQGIDVDNSGNIYITDSGNDRIRLINTNGIISTCAGNGILGFSGDGGYATFANIGGRAGLCCDNFNNIYLPETHTNRIRKVEGIITSIERPELNDYSLNVYPNPSSGKFIIESTKKENQTLEIFDPKGILVYKHNLIEKNNIDLSHLYNGIYTLIIKTKEVSISKKLVILK